MSDDLSDLPPTAEAAAAMAKAGVTAPVVGATPAFQPASQRPGAEVAPTAVPAVPASPMTGASVAPDRRTAVKGKVDLGNGLRIKHN